VLWSERLQRGGGGRQMGRCVTEADLSIRPPTEREDCDFVSRCSSSQFLWRVLTETWRKCDHQLRLYPSLSLSVRPHVTTQERLSESLWSSTTIYSGNLIFVKIGQQ
jgi:hypothetical protein